MIAQPKANINFNTRIIGKDSEYFNLLLDSNQFNKAARSISASTSAVPPHGHQPTITQSSYLVGKAGTLQTQTSGTSVIPAGDTITRNDTNNDVINKSDSLNPPGGLEHNRNNSGSTPNTSNYSHNNNNNHHHNTSKKKSKSRSHKSLHLVILEFIKIFNIKNDEILYIDCTEAAVKNMQKIN